MLCTLSCTYVRTYAHMYIQEIRKRCSTPRAFFYHQLKYTVSCISHSIAHCIIKRLVLKSKAEAGECGTVTVLVHLLEESSKLVPKAVHYVKGTYAHTHTYIRTYLYHINVPIKVGAFCQLPYITRIQVLSRQGHNGRHSAQQGRQVHAQCHRGTCYSIHRTRVMLSLHVATISVRIRRFDCVSEFNN